VRDYFGKTQKKDGQLENLWLISFADLMVQLMAFFAVVLSYTYLNNPNPGALIQALREELGLKSEVPEGDGILPGALGIDPDRASDLEKLVAEEKTEEGPDEGVRLRVVTFRGSILFDEGSAVVRQEFQPWLERIAALSREYQGYSLVLEGQAAPRERSRNGGDAWALSSERAQAVARRLVSYGIEPMLMIPEFRGDSIVEGEAASPEGRALARQVRFRFQRLENRE
jgi:chemotaxis protein MotB